LRYAPGRPETHSVRPTPNVLCATCLNHSPRLDSVHSVKRAPPLLLVNIARPVLTSLRLRLWSWRRSSGTLVVFLVASASRVNFAVWHVAPPPAASPLTRCDSLAGYASMSCASTFLRASLPPAQRSSPLCAGDECLRGTLLFLLPPFFSLCRYNPTPPPIFLLVLDGFYWPTTSPRVVFFHTNVLLISNFFVLFVGIPPTPTHRPLASDGRVTVF